MVQLRKGKLTYKGDVDLRQYYIVTYDIIDSGPTLKELEPQVLYIC